ncbi:hypothetical protein [Brevibacterium renqingii]|uniref:hypothetical protein n=1 Tax=Brevibacterium renqingii TaxID=2776916 RepID=UPI001AE01607|nr:hypothetical protein [Brevibacterium renqingii]
MTAAEPDWLDLRLTVDDAARQQSLPLLDRAVAALGPEDDKPLLVIDIGAGTGNSARWFDVRLRERLPGRELTWVLFDADRASLDLAGRSLPQARTVCGPISALPDIARGLLTVDLHRTAADRAGAAAEPVRQKRPDLLLTCSALLDVLTSADLDAIVRTLDELAGIGLFLLSITGGWSLDPAHQHDALLDAAFTAHQHRVGRLGCDAPDELMALARARGAEVMSGSSPWRLQAPEDREFLARFLTERIEAAVDEDPELAETGKQWCADRLRQLDARLDVTVGHRDVLIDASRTSRR